MCPKCVDCLTYFVDCARKKFAKRWEFTHTFSSPRYPQFNGRSEAAIKTAKRFMSKAKESGSVGKTRSLNRRINHQFKLCTAAVPVHFYRQRYSATDDAKCDERSNGTHEGETKMSSVLPRCERMANYSRQTNCMYVSTKTVAQLRRRCLAYHHTTHMKYESSMIFVFTLFWLDGCALFNTTQSASYYLKAQCHTEMAWTIDCYIAYE